MQHGFGPAAPVGAASRLAGARAQAAGPNAGGGFSSSRFAGAGGGHSGAGTFVAGAAVGAVGLALAASLPPHAAGGSAWVFEGRRYEPFYGPPYAWPRGYKPREIVEGGVLPPVFLTPAYFIDNYAYYRLSAPPPNYRWVRYGMDMALVRLSDGVIVRLVKGVFVDGPPSALAAGPAFTPAGWADPEEFPEDPPPPGVVQ